MMKKFLRFLLIACIAAFVCALACFTLIYAKYKSIAKQDIPVKYVKTELKPEEDVNLGEPLNVAITLKSPWNKYPSEAQINPSQGSQLYGSPKIMKIKREWGYTLWEVRFSIQAFTTGPIQEGDLKIIVSTDNPQKTDTLSLKMPGFNSLEIKNLTGELNVAGKIATAGLAQKSKNIYLAIALMVIGIALVLFFVFRKRKKKEKILSCWEIAIKDLNQLRSEYQSGIVNPLKCISQLTDIVRGYLEERFSIHAPKQTTSEFLVNMESSSSPLNNKNRNFLREFMVSADMIKFAKHEACKEMIESSISRAALLIEESIPSQDELKQEEAGEQQ